MNSGGIRVRTTALVVTVVALVWILAAWLTWREAEHEAAEIFDGHLAQAASMLVAQTSVELEDADDREDGRHAPLPHRYARKVAFQLWDRDGQLLVHSENAPDAHLGPADEGFSDSQVEGEPWRVFSTWNPRHDVLVQVGERIDARSEMAEEVAEGLLRPLLWSLPLLSVLLWLVIGRAIRPLATLAAEIADRSPDRLEPLRGMKVPTEIEPLVRRLDELLRRVGEALGSEKRFTGDAAHELRTPIAALCAQAEVALAANDDAVRRRALSAVLAAARRMGRLVEQLLTLARADSQLEADWPQVDLAKVARDTLAAMLDGGSDEGAEIELDAPDQILVRGEAGWLGVLVRNLADNALRFSPPGGMVRLVIAREVDGAVALSVTDQGPGVSAEDLQRLGERFWRQDGQQGSGSGLGLSIVRRVAELHRARLVFGAGEGGVGLVVRVRFPPDR